MLQQDGKTHESSTLAAHAFLSTIGKGRQLVSFKKNATIFTQGDAPIAGFFIRSGRVKLNVVSGGGKEAVLGILGKNEFIGESALVGRLPSLCSAIAMTDTILIRIKRTAMTLAMQRDSVLSTSFIQYLLERNIRRQEDLVDQLFNSSEKRLARVLLLLANPGKKTLSGGVVPKLSQETLADMVGTTRSRISFFMNRFRKLNLIHYGAGDNLHVHSSLLHIFLRDDNVTGNLAEHNSTGQLRRSLPIPPEEQQEHTANRRKQYRVFESAA